MQFYGESAVQGIPLQSSLRSDSLHRFGSWSRAGRRDMFASYQGENLESISCAEQPRAEDT